MAVTTLDPRPETPTPPARQEEPLYRHKRWEAGPFRFHFSLENFRPGRDFSLRRFSIAEAAVLLMMGLIASRGLGVIRQIIFNAIFGTSVQASVYYAAFRLPETVFNLIAGGTLIHAFIPIFVSYEKERGQEEIWRLTSLVFNIMFATLTVLLLIAEFLAPTFVSRLLVPGFSPSEQALTTTLTRIMLAQPLIMGLGTIITGVLSSKRQFFLPALAIAVYNVGLIGGLLVSLAIPSVGIYGPTFGVLAAALCHLFVQIPGVVKQKFRYWFVWNLRDPGLHEVLGLLIPSLLSVAILSIGPLVDTSFTSFFKDKGSIAALNNAELLFALPLALLGQALARAALPRMSFIAAGNQYVRLRRLSIQVISGAAILSVPTAIVLAIVGRPLIHLLFQHGAFTKHSSNLVYLALIGYAVVLPAHVVDNLFQRSFYALKDARTPLFANILQFGAHVGLILLLIRLLRGKYLLLSIPLAAGGAAAIEALLLGYLFFLRLRKKASLDKGYQHLQGQYIPAETPEEHTKKKPEFDEVVQEELPTELVDGPEKQVPELAELTQKEVVAEPEVETAKVEEAAENKNDLIEDA